MDVLQDIINDFSVLDEVEAFALGGSRSTGEADEKSDYDVYIYVTEEVSEKKRQTILEKYCSVMEIGNKYWETEDNCTLTAGIDIDLIYRSLDDFAGGISRTVDSFEAGTGYTTCMWHNLLTSEIKYDRNGRLSALKEKYTVPYPEQLKTNIIRKNMNLLSGVLPSYDLQIKKAIVRNDIVSVNHRTAAFLASYFDVIFAANKMTHPGEKRLISICEEKCKILPEDFRPNLEALLPSLYTGDAVNAIIAGIVQNLREIL
ncbi:nucleotidyltransferase domain-containing protein [Brucepastera parasyntrophica]|uniref:nucleotidyltransferase domain-containing protein n=1 Tax=Brucepastera parasyntrophica TaxID=2880008 RepID=UPI00210EC70D|nr:nucleotidyltransferase domain-containing protein [Brucepastera parasyntrophica]ULQ58909.1 nucleotidyltransferase domain-containing protein [Brucepastera parasyntrophica]